MQRQFCMVGRMADLPQIVAFIDASSVELGVDESVRFDLQLAVEEACTNVIEHAYRGQGGDVEICFETRGTDVWITIHDHGQSFDPGSVPRPDLHLPLEERQIGGLGLHLMQQLMDEVRFSFGQDGNTLVMIKRNVVLPTRWADAA